MRARTEPVIAVLGSTVRDGEALPLLRSRLETAAEQWRTAERHRLRPYVFCLGGMGTQGLEPEAPVMADRLVELGVPRDRIVEEAFSRTTEENLFHLQAILHDPGFPGAWAGLTAEATVDVRSLTLPDEPPTQPILIVTSRFHMPRALLMARSMGLNAEGAAAPNSLRDALMLLPREAGALVLWGIRSLRRTAARS